VGPVSCWYPIETERLVLRPYRDTDFDALLGLQTRDDVTRYLLYDAKTPERVHESLALRMMLPPLDADGQALTLAAELRATGAVIGDVTLFRVSMVHQQGEIGFVFHPDFHGHGYAREAAQAVLRAGFDRLGMHRIVGRCDARNSASAALMKRLGMRQEAHFVRNEYIKGEWTDELVFAILEDDQRTAR
jgi:RimJ/RimL family protein N-acetyltransferase